MKRYKRYGTIYWISYISFFIYLLAISTLKFNIDEFYYYAPYFIIIPLLVYCGVVVTINVLANKFK